MAKILVVDDSVALRMQVKACLNEDGHEVVEAKDGKEGYNYAKAHLDLDLMIVDFNMPILNGLELCAKVRELAEHKQTPIFMLTTESSPQALKRGKEVGVLAWIIKPFSEDKLRYAINKVLK